MRYPRKPSILLPQLQPLSLEHSKLKTEPNKQTTLRGQPSKGCKPRNTTSSRHWVLQEDLPGTMYSCRFNPEPSTLISQPQTYREKLNLKYIERKPQPQTYKRIPQPQIYNQKLNPKHIEKLRHEQIEKPQPQTYSGKKLTPGI